MSEPRHTPGPWKADETGVWAGGHYIAETFTDGVANATLIAAAPDMLAALKSLFENPLFELGAAKFDGRPSSKAKAGALAAWDVLVESAKASIAKAEGRS